MKNQRCQCGGCKQWFTSVDAFDRHRKGTHEDGQRYCLTVDWLLEAAGLRKILIGKAEKVYWTNSRKLSKEKIQLLREKQNAAS
jgi:tyrosyl-tRNA synthetase